MGKRSKFDPYKDLLTVWCLQGVPVRVMADKLMDKTGEIFDETAIHAYIYKHQLRKRPWKDVYEARNQCKECEYCHSYINTNNAEGRICSFYWRTIQNNVRHSPVWCEK